MKNTLAVVISLAVIFLMTGCGQNESEKAAAAAKDAQIKIDQAAARRATFEFLAEERQAVKNNVTKSAASYRADNPRLDGMDMVAHTDSTISAECPQGDGWASVSFLERDPNIKNRKQAVEKVEVYCSTVDEAIGCFTKEVFQNKAVYAKQNDHCDVSLPSPLPRFK